MWQHSKYVIINFEKYFVGFVLCYVKCQVFLFFENYVIFLSWFR
jgi:hypothetical protein